MPLDPDLLLRLPPIETRQHLTPKKVILYALGVGAHELPFVYEEGLQALPGMAVILAYPGFIWRDPAYGIDWTKILHGETSVICHAPLPVSGEVVGCTTFGPIFDKGAAKGAVVYQTRENPSRGRHACRNSAKCDLSARRWRLRRVDGGPACAACNPGSRA